MIRSLNGKSPKIAPSAFISEAAYIVGDVEVGENSGVWPGAVIRADIDGIRIGTDTDIEDNSVLHADLGGMEIGNNVIVGHNAVVEARRIGDNVLIGNNATVLLGVEIGDFCAIAANSVVPEGTFIPSGSFVAGVPGKIKGKLSENQRKILELHLEYYSELRKKHKKEGL